MTTLQLDQALPVPGNPVSRRTVLRGAGGTVLAGLSVLRLAGPATAFQTSAEGEVIPWVDQPAENPVPEVIVQQLTWEDLDSWITPNDQFSSSSISMRPRLTRPTGHFRFPGWSIHP